MLTSESKQPFPQESETLEYKEIFTPHLKREICALLNNNLVNNKQTSYIYVGVNDDRKLAKHYTAKQKHSFEEIISRWATDAFYPEATSFITTYADNEPFCIRVTSPRNQVFTVQEGKHPHPSLYIRSGSSSKRAGRDMFRRLIHESHPKTFDGEVSSQQKLTFNYLHQALKRKHKHLYLSGISEFYTRSKYSNTALLFSDQNPYVTKSASFVRAGVNTDFSPKVFRGSILKQIDDSLKYVNYRYNTVRYLISASPMRTDRWDFPRTALREALINSFAHRSYFIPQMFTEINAYKTKLDIQSPGAIPDELQPS